MNQGKAHEAIPFITYCLLPFLPNLSLAKQASGALARLRLAVAVLSFTPYLCDHI